MLPLCYKRALDIMVEFRKASSYEQKGHCSRNNSRWSPPEQGVTKINVDATIKTNDDKVGLGVVARDWEGKVLLSASNTILLYL